VILADTNTLVYASGSKHALREPALALFGAAVGGTVGATTTPDVIQEFIHVYSRARARADAVSHARRWLAILTPLVGTTQEDVPVALRLFERHEAINAFDALLAAVALREDLVLVSADRAFADVPKLRFVELGSPELDRLLG
jgi:predicted nucleic acid-binding protein